ncbi:MULTISPECIES: asparagine synthase (glutamine-hydrolyzing) [Bacillaceae]|uniref:asparagine synthase (glutamine-hydrolyzing) n=1 Tax=Evansella alkalicola TaxID=745819 RepID=A0ABS6JWD9_9BACI|nr:MULTISPECIES: asparagine synthase (glutamine-hydrolyzing) [Bacillaceae]MBU9721440.1 asparagine synthase (glutamine-hydrolyzing) [Bacillus alkalicola]
MCGINSYLSFSNQSINPTILQQMSDNMIHRGPDDEGFWIEKTIGMSFRRLSIIDTEGAQQPILNENETIVMICNGEIYNYRVLRNELEAKGHHFKTDGDTETIIHLYEEYGIDCVHHLRGMFSFILWDKKTNTLFGARDHFGIKPFYYLFDEQKLICSSELKSILKVSNQSHSLDPQSLVHYLTYQYVPEPRTMVNGINKLLPGHRLICRNQSLKIERYWEPTFQPKEQDVEVVKEKILTTLQESVKLHMQSDVTLGSFLSSGIDSTAIAAIMRKETKFHTFSVGFEGEQNECTVSRKTAEILDTYHHEWIIKEDEYFEAVNSSVWAQDDPVADPSAVALNLLSQLASEHVKVVLSGEGADELFGGYRIYQEPFAIRHIQLMPEIVKNILHQTIKHFPKFYGKNYIIRATTPIEKRFIGNAKIFTDDMVEILNDNKMQYQYVDAFEWAEQYYNRVKEHDDITKMQFIDLSLWLPGNILAKGDKMSMAHSLELRVPFLDKKVFEVASQIPTEYRVNRNRTKKIMRDALQGIVPEHVLNRPKLGFPVPLRQWLRGLRGEECLDVIKSSGLDQYINIDYVDALFRQHQTGKIDHSRKIWSLYTLSQWKVMFLDRYQSSIFEQEIQKNVVYDGHAELYA